MAFGLFQLYANSYGFLMRNAFETKRARGGRWAWGLEVLCVVMFWVWFGKVLIGCGSWKMAFVYLIVSHAVTSPLHVQVCRVPYLFTRDSNHPLSDRPLPFLNVNSRPRPNRIIPPPPT